MISRMTRAGIALTSAARCLRVIERSQTSEAEELKVRDTCTRIGRQEKDDDRNAVLNLAAQRVARAQIRPGAIPSNPFEEGRQ